MTESSRSVTGEPLAIARGSIRPLRVLIVAPSLDILGGQAVQAARLMTRLGGESSLAIGFLPINPRLPGILRKLQAIKYVRTVVTSLLYVATLLARVRRYDCIHVFSASYFSFVLAPTPAILIAKLYGKKVVLNYHSGEAEDHLARWRSAIKVIRWTDEIAVPSEYLVRVFARFGLRARAICNTIETETFRFRARPSLRPAFLSNRNLESHYGVDCVLRAFAIIQKRFPEACLTVAGDGSERGALEQLARELNLRNVEFKGQVDPAKVFLLYDAADIYLNGSKIDNQPLSLLEAFACGLPVVTTNAGGIPDIVTHERTGLLVKRDDYQAMADAAIRLLEDAQLAARITSAGREECRKYSWNAVRNQWLELYAELAPGAAASETQKTEGRRRKVKRLRQLRYDELRVRGAQVLNAFAERHGWSSLAKLPTDQGFFHLLAVDQTTAELKSADGLLEHFRTRTAPNFFSGVSDRESTVLNLRAGWPQAERQIVEKADRIIAGKFDLLGLRDLSFSDPIDWQLEPISGKRAPLLHWSRLNYLDAGVIGDKKIVWELNRQQYLATLGQAYWLTGDERYAQTFAAHLTSWMDQNPPKEGINWASSLEVAFRSISWLWAFYFFRDSPALTSSLFQRALKFLYLHARHLETYLSTYFSPNTHLTGEALGLYYLGTMLPEFRDAARWREAGRRILLAQMARHVQPDGVYFEQSSYYHRYTTDFYIHFLVLSRLNNQTIGGDVEEKLKLLLDHLMHITRPDGTTPFFGDDDGGRLMMLDQRPANDFRATLGTAAALFQRGDYKYVAGEAAEETLWLLGPRGLGEFDRVAAHEPALQSVAFPNGGYYVMRDGWTPTSNYLLFDSGPHGADNCGHAHADALAFEVAANGKTMLVDPGTYTYTGSKEMREWFRGSMAHNTLTVDRQSSSVPAGPFSWSTVARCEAQSWISRERFDFCEGRHDGYQRLDPPVMHSRGFLFLKNDYWVIRDRIKSEGQHQYDLWFHFDAGIDPGLQAREGFASRVEATVGSARLGIASFGRKSLWQREEAPVSHCYAETEVAPVYVFSTTATGDDLVTFLLPGTRSEPSARVREVEAIGGRAFEVVGESTHDIVMIKSGSRVEMARMTADFDWTWARFADESATVPEELVLIGGQRLELEGKEVLRSGRRINYLVASRVGDQFRIETDDGVLDLRVPVRDFESAFSNYRKISDREI